MPATPHIEKHFTATAAVRDVVIGMSDGLTVPFALAAGISGAVASNPHAIRTRGDCRLCGNCRGLDRHGLGGYLAARTDLEHYASEREREIRETVELPDMRSKKSRKFFALWTDRSADVPRGHRDYGKSKKLGGFHDAL